MVFISFFLIVHDEEHLFIFSFLYYSSPAPSRQGLSCGPDWLTNHFVAQVGFKHIIFLPLLPKCCDYRTVPLCLTYGMVLLKNYFKFYTYVFLCGYMCVSAGVHGGQQYQILSEPELQVVVSQLRKYWELRLGPLQEQ